MKRALSYSLVAVAIAGLIYGFSEFGVTIGQKIAAGMTKIINIKLF